MFLGVRVILFKSDEMRSAGGEKKLKRIHIR